MRLVEQSKTKHAKVEEESNEENSLFSSSEWASIDEYFKDLTESKAKPIMQQVLSPSATWK